jgi:hypothetical protein
MSFVVEFNRNYAMIKYNLFVLMSVIPVNNNFYYKQVVICCTIQTLKIFDNTKMVNKKNFVLLFAKNFVMCAFLFK